MPKLTKQALFTRFSPIFWKNTLFLVLDRFYPPFRVYARIRARLEKTPLYTRFLVYAWVPKSNSSCPPPPPGSEPIKLVITAAIIHAW